MKVLVIGPKGKMGSLIVQSVIGREGLEIAGGTGPKGRDYIGQDIGLVSKCAKLAGAKVYDDIEEIIEGCDVIIDYTSPQVSMEVLKSALKHKKAFVCGTTGFSEEEKLEMKEASKEIPLVYAANTSKIVNLMYRLLEMAAKSIGEKSDIEIIEMHDRDKKDAPSGTSREMGEIMANALGREFAEVAKFGRDSSRNEGEIGYHSVRAGDISSSHTAMFGLMGERLEITHHAHNWICFAEGACDCAEFLKGKKPGFYTVKDVLGV